MGRADLIGNGKKHLVPSFQPAGTGYNRTRDGHNEPRTLSNRARAGAGQSRRDGAKRR